MNYFTTREFAIGTWAIIAFVTVLCSKKVRDPFWQVIKALCVWKLQLVFWFLAIYTSAIIYVFHTTPLWSHISVKEVIIWFLFAGIPLVFSAWQNLSKDGSYFINILRGNIKFIIVVSFIINFYTFSYWIEMLFLPCIVILGIMVAYANTSKEFDAASKFFGFIEAVLGLVLLFYALKSLIADYPNWWKQSTLVSLILPTVLSLLFIPIAYILAVIVVYETMYVRVSWFQDKCSPKELLWRKWTIFLTCKLSSCNINSATMSYCDIYIISSAHPLTLP
ncbi:MAG: hypothetical protein PHV82_17175 [Victivallaceae bacterium]|nr:hypothetical protein [Victivallaceae bacterium]